MKNIREVGPWVVIIILVIGAITTGLIGEDGLATVCGMVAFLMLCNC